VAVLRLRLCRQDAGPEPACGLAPSPQPLSPEGRGASFDDLVAQRRREADEFYAGHFHHVTDPEQRRLARLASAGLLWSKQFYHYVVPAWLEGDPGQPPPPPQRKVGRNHDWGHLF